MAQSVPIDELCGFLLQGIAERTPSLLAWVAIFRLWCAIPEATPGLSAQDSEPYTPRPHSSPENSRYEIHVRAEYRPHRLPTAKGVSCLWAVMIPFLIHAKIVECAHPASLGRDVDVGKSDVIVTP